MKINNIAEMSKFFAAGKIVPVISSADSFALYFRQGEKIQEIARKENPQIAGEFLLHDEEKFCELLQNIQEFNKTQEKACICIEEFQNIIREVKFPLTV